MIRKFEYWPEPRLIWSFRKTDKEDRCQSAYSSRHLDFCGAQRQIRSRNFTFWGGHTAASFEKAEFEWIGYFARDANVNVSVTDGFDITVSNSPACSPTSFNIGGAFGKFGPICSFACIV